LPTGGGPAIDRLGGRDVEFAVARRDDSRGGPAGRSRSLTRRLQSSRDPQPRGPLRPRRVTAADLHWRSHHATPLLAAENQKIDPATARPMRLRARALSPSPAGRI